MIIDKDHKLTTDEICKILQKHRDEVAPKLLTLWNYYENKHIIQQKPQPDRTRPCNKLTYSFPEYIADNYTSYMVGNQVAYKSEKDEALKSITDILNYNDAGDLDTKIALDLCVCGIAYELHYIDEDSQKRFTRVAPWEISLVRDDTIDGNILYAIRYIRRIDINGKTTYMVDVYDNKKVVHYTADDMLTSTQYAGEELHYFGDVPLVPYENKSSFENVISLVDAYEKLSSAEVDDYEAFVDAMLVLKGVTITDEKDADGNDDLSLMKKNRVLLLEQDSDASYLTKEVNSQQIENILDKLAENIHKLSGCPNFADEAFGTSSGIAMAYKLLGFTNAGKKRIRAMKKGLQRRLELLCNILGLTDSAINYRDIEVVFTPNLPVDDASTVEAVTSLRGLVSDETLISQLPFVEDVSAEMERIAAQNANTYNVAPGDGEDE